MRYIYYHCTGYRGKCPEPYTREELLKQRFASRLRELVVPPPVLTWLRSEMVESGRMKQDEREQERRRLKTESERLQTRLEVLYDDRLDGRIDIRIHDKKAGEIREQLDRIS
jgi:site-specific DNA recombinase